MAHLFAAQPALSPAAGARERGKYQLLIGDVRAKLREIKKKSVQTVITSPPYWGLRNYGVDGQIGSEPTPEEFVRTMVDVFGLVRETLRDDGTLWLNLGDSYAQDKKWGGTTGGKHARGLHGTSGIGRNRTQSGLPGGSQLLMPHRVAMALQAGGWILRSTVIWHKRSPMPESIRGWRWVRCRVKVPGTGWTKETHPEYVDPDQIGRSGAFGSHNGTQQRADVKWLPCPGCNKCRENGGWVLRRGKWRATTSHEYVFLFSKSESYFADGDAVAEVASYQTHSRGNNTRQKFAAEGSGTANNPSFNQSRGDEVETKNPRSVWTLSNEPYKGAHFATFPSELVRRCLLATTPEQCCSLCGAGYAPVIEKERVPTRPGCDSKVGRLGIYEDSPYHDHNGTIIGNRDPQRHIQRTKVLDHWPTCGCVIVSADGSNRPAPGRSIVLDPFGGSMTTVQTTVWYGRDAIAIDINPEYVAMGEERIAKPPRCLVREERARKIKPAKIETNGERQLELVLDG